MVIESLECLPKSSPSPGFTITVEICDVEYAGHDGKKDERQLLPAQQALPETYLLVELEDGNAVIPRDFFLTICPN